MNGAHFHLIINHLPVLGVPVGLLLLAYSRWKGNSEMTRFSYYFIIGVALVSIPAFLTGEPAEDVLKKLPDYPREFVHEHEEMAEIGFVLTLLSGGLSLLSLCLNFINSKVKQFKIIEKFIPGLLFVSLVAAMAVLGYAANLGGEIRHTENRNPTVAE